MVSGDLISDINQDIGNFPAYWRYNWIFHFHGFKEKKRLSFSNFLVFFHFQFNDGSRHWGGYFFAHSVFPLF
ncbi:hypothetical protein DESC_180040 [Desulfosarcina cetonica]|nr:hypothetical protein DESC_180040 [Desulfosarcina cetonica]